MSMYMVGSQHIDALIHFAGRAELIKGLSPTQAGKMLWFANLESCHTRYPDTMTGGEYPGPISFKGERTIRAYRYATPDITYSPARVWGLAECFDYQACEFDGWRRSDAHDLIQKIIETCKRMGATDYEGWSLD